MLLKREDLTYDKLRSFIADYCQSVAPLQPTPMDVGSFQPLTSADYSWGYLQKDEPKEPEPVDSFGKAAKGAGVGKGQGGPGGKNGMSDMKCRICERTGHKWAACWYKGEKDASTGKSKGDLAADKGGKGKGK